MLRIVKFIIDPEGKGGIGTYDPYPCLQNPSSESSSDMKRSDLIPLILIFLFACTGPTENEQSVVVHHHGTLRDIMKKGDLSPKVDLRELEKEGLYALGAVNGLQGEILILDGKAYIASVEEGKLRIDRTYDHEASLLVRSHVKDWESFDIPEGMSTQKLAARIGEKAQGMGLEAPFPFRIEGRASSFTWHVIDWEEGDTVHTHKKHKHSGLRGREMDRKVEVLGFYSAESGIFTHHKSPMHMHVCTKNEELAGHLERIRVGKGMRLLLPFEKGEQRK
jgi:acetolactate decarboxylase